MIKTAFEVATHVSPKAMQPSGAAMMGAHSGNTQSSSGRFPPIENALSEIINNKRLEEAKKDV